MDDLTITEQVQIAEAIFYYCNIIGNTEQSEVSLKTYDYLQSL